MIVKLIYEFALDDLLFKFPEPLKLCIFDDPVYMEVPEFGWIFSISDPVSFRSKHLINGVTALSRNNIPEEDFDKLFRQFTIKFYHEYLEDKRNKVSTVTMDEKQLARHQFFQKVKTKSI